MVASASYFLTGHETTTLEGGWVEWETSLDTNFFRSRVSRREPRWLTIQKRRWLGTGGRRRGILARSFIRLHASSPPFFFFSSASLLREGSNDLFKKIADLRGGTLSFFFFP